MTPEDAVARGLPRGAAWRSPTVFECAVCGTRTNRWMMSGAPGTGPRLACPASEFTEHERLESMGGDNADARFLRGLFTRALDDVAGVPADAPVRVASFSTRAAARRSLLEEAAHEEPHGSPSEE